MPKDEKEKNKFALERAPTGVPGLDELVQGGLERNSVTLVCGETGAGKSTLGLQFLHNGAKDYGEAGMFVSFGQNEDALGRHARTFGWDLAGLSSQGLFKFIRYAPHEVAKLVDEGGGTIHDTIDSLGIKRVVIDSLTSYALLFESKYRTRESILALFDMLESWNCTSLVITDVVATLEGREPTGAEFLADSVIVLYHPRKESTRIRALEILKMRGTQHAEKLCPFEFGEKGITVYPGEEVFEEV